LKSKQFLAPLAVASLLVAASAIAPSAMAPSADAQTKNDSDKAGKETARENAATRATNFTFVEARSSISPRAFEGSDGVTNLVYELILTNYGSNPVTIDGIEISDADGGKVLLNMPNDKLRTEMICPGVKKQEGTMTPGVISLVFVNIELKKDEKVPDLLVHKIHYSGTLADKSKNKTTVLEVVVDHSEPVVLGSPLVGKKWLATGGYSSPSGHRRSIFPVGNELKSAQRFAIDWVQLDDKNKLFSDDGKENSKWTGYGKPVLAVADGTVYGVVNRFEDQPPFKASGSLTFPAGNSITLQIGDKAYAMYAHLKPGSIKVKEGDVVKKGQQLAEVGSVGNSDGPHLHLHITEGPEVLESNGIPYVFEQFNVSGAVDVEVVNKNFDKPMSFSEVKVDNPGVHKLQLIKEGLLIDFPELSK